MMLFSLSRSQRVRLRGHLINLLENNVNFDYLLLDAAVVVVSSPFGAGAVDGAGCCR